MGFGVGVEGLKRHLTQYRKEFPDATLIRINYDLDNSYDKMWCNYLHMQKKF